MASTAVARETLFALRKTIARLEGKSTPALAAARQQPREQTGDARQGSHDAAATAYVLPFGVTDLDHALQGGLPLDGLTEIRTSTLRDAATATGFTLALVAKAQRRFASRNTFDTPVLWIGNTVATMEAGTPYAVSLSKLGILPETFFHIAPPRLEDALWLAENALASAAFAGIVLETNGNPARFGLTESRRLHLRAQNARRPLFVVRQGGEEEASSAIFRLHLASAPASLRRLPDGSALPGSIGNPVFHLTLEKSRLPAPLSLYLEWHSHEHRFSIAPAPEPVADRHAASAHSGSGIPPSSDRPDRPQEMGAIVAWQRAS